MTPATIRLSVYVKAGQGILRLSSDDDDDISLCIPMGVERMLRLAEALQAAAEMCSGEKEPEPQGTAS